MIRAKGDQGQVYEKFDHGTLGALEGGLDPPTHQHTIPHVTHAHVRVHPRSRLHLIIIIILFLGLGDSSSMGRGEVFADI